MSKNDDVNHPKHYTQHPSGVECIQITEHMPFCIGNAVKYLWRAGLKSDDAVKDLRKAEWYIKREISRLEGEFFGMSGVEDELKMPDTLQTKPYGWPYIKGDE